MNNKSEYIQKSASDREGYADEEGKSTSRKNDIVIGVLVALCICSLAFISFQQYEISQLSNKMSSIQGVVNGSRTFSQLVQESAQLSKTISTVRQNLTRDTLIMANFNITGYPQVQIQNLQAEVNQAQASANEAQISAELAYNFSLSFVDVIALAFTVFSIIISMHHYGNHKKTVRAMTFEKSIWLNDVSSERVKLIDIECNLALAFFAENCFGYLFPIIFLPPACAIVNWIMLSFNGSWLNAFLGSFQGIIDCWTAAAIYCFFKLMTKTMVILYHGIVTMNRCILYSTHS